MLFEVIPNFSEGASREFLKDAVRAYLRHGAEVLHWTADRRHNRMVLTAIGGADELRSGSIAAARLALARLNLARHKGLHPRVGVLDVLPFVPLEGAAMPQARTLARETGAALAKLGIPVYFYGDASTPPGRGLAEIRRGGFEALRARTNGLLADLPGARKDGPARRRAHPTAGAACVGARKTLLAWNVCASGLSLEQARLLASGIRETGGGFPGLRALAFSGDMPGAVQISMNLEDVETNSPMEVYGEIRSRVEASGGRLLETEVIGMFPDVIGTRERARALGVSDWSKRRLLSLRAARHAKRIRAR